MSLVLPCGRVTSSPSFTPQNPGFTWSYAWGEPQVSWSDRELEHRGQAEPVSYLPCRILSPAWVFSSLLSSIPRSPLEARGRVREKQIKERGVLCQAEPSQAIHVHATGL